MSLLIKEFSVFFSYKKRKATLERLHIHQNLIAESGKLLFCKLCSWPEIQSILKKKRLPEISLSEIS